MSRPKTFGWLSARPLCLIPCPDHRFRSIITLLSARAPGNAWARYTSCSRFRAAAYLDKSRPCRVSSRGAPLPDAGTLGEPSARRLAQFVKNGSQVLWFSRFAVTAFRLRRTDRGDGTGSAERMGGLRGLGERVKPDTSDPRRRTRLTALIFSLRAGSAGRDAGLVLPKITDEFAGRAPDFGAFETGRPHSITIPDDFIGSQFPAARIRFRCSTSFSFSHTNSMSSVSGCSSNVSVMVHGRV